MSNRTRQADAAKLDKRDRRDDRRRERHSAKARMRGEADVISSKLTTRHREKPKAEHVAPVVEPKRLKHWKEPFWKRRKLERKRRAELYLRAEKEGLPCDFLEEEVGMYDTDPYAYIHESDQEVRQTVSA